MNQLTRFIVKNKTAIAIILVIIVVAIIFYRKGKKKTTIADVPNDTPNGNTGNGGVNLSGNQLNSNQIVMYADQLHEDINCVFCTRNTKLYEDLAIVSDTDLVKIYNAYNAKYQLADKETLLQALQSELTAWFSSTAPANMEALMKRLQKYNLL